MPRLAVLTLDQIRQRDAAALKRWRSRADGRKCKHCGVPDKVRAFDGLKCCMNCAKQLVRNKGQICEFAGCKLPAKTKPVQELKEGQAEPVNVFYCRKHRIGPTDVLVTILCRGNQETVPVQRYTLVKLPSGEFVRAWRLATDNSVSMVVRPQDFWNWRVNRPIAVVGMDPVPTRDTAYTLVEFLHNPGVDEETGCRTLSPEWFERRFGHGKSLKTWKRSFERAKQRFRALGIDPTNIDMQRLRLVLKLGEAAWFSETN